MISHTPMYMLQAILGGPGAKTEARAVRRISTTREFLNGDVKSISLEDLQPTVKICVDSLSTSSVAVKRLTAAKLWLLAKNQSDNRALIEESDGIPALISLLQCTGPWSNKPLIVGDEETCNCWNSDAFGSD
ncbi:hypothetical protein L2E82_20321 [Cichorium intybus]|uniref:Uncharacterized protein n=1 Tax=Cichorium intybus TaxID=13427 RepID=A0ACB9DTC6_CICIN|nr:hypothetical protein L2E82_20321 [Cichorium intybus]